jgi:hypothetical protein
MLETCGIAAHAAGRDGNGRRLVVRNGYHRPREVLTSVGKLVERPGEETQPEAA